MGTPARPWVAGPNASQPSLYRNSSRSLCYHWLQRVTWVSGGGQAKRGWGQLLCPISFWRAHLWYVMVLRTVFLWNTVKWRPNPTSWCGSSECALHADRKYGTTCIFVHPKHQAQTYVKHLYVWVSKLWKPRQLSRNQQRQGVSAGQTCYTDNQVNPHVTRLDLRLFLSWSHTLFHLTSTLSLSILQSQLFLLFESTALWPITTVTTVASVSIHR